MINSLNEIADLISITEITKKLKVTRRTVERWRCDTIWAFPKPKVYVGSSPMWTEEDIVNWLNGNRKLHEKL